MSEQLPSHKIRNGLFAPIAAVALLTACNPFERDSHFNDHDTATVALSGEQVQSIDEAGKNRVLESFARMNLQGGDGATEFHSTIDNITPDSKRAYSIAEYISFNESESGAVVLTFDNTRAGYVIPVEQQSDSTTGNPDKWDFEYAASDTITLSNSDMEKPDIVALYGPEGTEFVEDFLKSTDTHVTEIMTDGVGMYDRLLTQIDGNTITVDVSDARGPSSYYAVKNLGQSIGGSSEGTALTDFALGQIGD